MHVIVAVPTLDRPASLRRCIDSVLIAAIPPETTVTVLVVDNGSAVPARSVLPDPVVVLDEPERGLAQVRNRALDYAEAEGADLIAFIDDDETCDPRWLVEIVEAHRQTGAEVVTGPTQPDFGPHSAAPALASYFAASVLPHLSPRDEAYTANAAFARSCFAGPESIRFDTAYDHSGGEDAEFTLRLARTGRRIVWSAHALVNVHIQPERLRWRWLIARHIGYGERKARILLTAGEVTRAQLALYGAVSVLRSGLLMGVEMSHGRTPLTMLRPGLFGIGCALQAAGVETQIRAYRR